MKPMMRQALDYHEVGKSILTVADESKVIDELRDNTKKRKKQKIRWQNTNAEEFRSKILRA